MFLDTAGLVALFDEADSHHADAVLLVGSAPVLLTHSYVLAEVVALCNARRLNRERALAFAVGILDNPDTDVVWVEESLHRSALALLKQRPDKDYSLCDAVSFILMRERRIQEALTTDRDFEREGFTRLLKP